MLDGGGDDSSIKGKFEGLFSYEAMKNFQLEESPLENLQNTITRSSKDWSQTAADAWIFAIVVGWGNKIEEIARKFSWGRNTIEKLQRLNLEYQKLMGKQSN